MQKIVKLIGAASGMPDHRRATFRLLLLIGCLLLQPLLLGTSVGQERPEMKKSPQTRECSEVKPQGHDDSKKQLTLERSPECRTTVGQSSSACGESRQKRIKVGDEFVEDDEVIKQPKVFNTKSNQKRMKVGDDFFEKDKTTTPPKSIGKPTRQKRIRVKDDFLEEKQPIKDKRKIQNN